MSPKTQENTVWYIGFDEELFYSVEGLFPCHHSWASKMGKWMKLRESPFDRVFHSSSRPDLLL